MACGKLYNVARNMLGKSITDTKIDSFLKPHYSSTYHGLLFGENISYPCYGTTAEFVATLLKQLKMKRRTLGVESDWRGGER